MGVLLLILKVGLHRSSKRNKLAENISQKNPEYMLNYSLPCSCSWYLSSFWFVIKQKLTTIELSILSNNSHLEWRARLSDTILKGNHPRTIPAKFALIWFSDFIREDLNVTFYQNMSNLYNQYKSVERKTSQKNPEYMLIYRYSLSCSCS